MSIDLTLETIDVRCPAREPYAVVTLTRPERLNAASPKLFRELALVMRQLDDDEAIRAIVLTGAGPKAFSAGGDLGEMSFGDAASAQNFIRCTNEPFVAIEGLTKVVIAAVNGLAIGFGFELTAVCDLAIASARARFRLPEVSHGLLPIVGVQRGAEVVGRRKLAWLALASEELSAEEARQFGVVNEVVGDDDLLPTCLSIAKRVAELPSTYVATIKRLVNHHATERYLEIENTMPALLRTADVHEGLNAFSERRSPVFLGL